jgi:hypothetical protein
MPMPVRNDLRTWWEDPANLTHMTRQGAYDLVSPGQKNWWDKTAPAWDQVDISKGQAGNPIIFVWGPAGAFHDLPTSETLYIDNFTVTGQTGTVAGLRVAFEDSDEGWSRALLTIREIGRELDSNNAADVADVISIITHLIGTLIPRGGLLSPPEMQGLYGELTLFEKLLNIADAQVPAITHQSVLDSWKGYLKPARRDYSRTGSSIVIEVKTTGNDDRRHKIANYLQLVEQHNEHLFLYSVAAKFDATGTDSLPSIVDRITQHLNPGHQNSFSGYLAQYGDHGYHSRHVNHYNDALLVGQFTPELFDLRLIEYFDGFGNNPAPWASSEYSYTLLLDGMLSAPMAPAAQDTTLLGLLQ